MSEQRHKDHPKSLYLIVGMITLVFAVFCLQPITTSERPATMQATVKNELKQLAVAVYNYHDSDFASPFLLPPEDSEELEWSWETRLLPQLEAGPTYDAIDFTQPWNAPANKEAFSAKVWGFESPAADSIYSEEGYAMNHFSANEHIRGLEISFTTRGLPDGMATTILMGEAFGNFRPWGQPGNYRDPLDGINQSFDGFGSNLRTKTKWYQAKGKSGCRIGFCDGAVRFISEDIDPDVLRRLALPNDGEPVEEF